MKDGKLEVGDKVRLTGKEWDEDGYPGVGAIVTVSEVDSFGAAWSDGDAGSLTQGNGSFYKGGFAVELVEPGAEAANGKILSLPAATRITVVTEDGLTFERYGAYPNGMEIHLQDDGRTVKIFPRSDA